MNEETEYRMVPSQESSSSMVEIEQAKAQSEVQASLVIAKKFPRDQTAAFSRIMQACKRKSLAEVAVYEYPKGGTKVTGPSIRLAEVLAQNWGNLQTGLIELDRINGVSTVQAFAWDLETNVRQSLTYQVRHIRDTKQGSRALTDEREIYETIANQGARRRRACILGILPGDVVDEAVIECEKTLAGDNKEPIQDRVRKMVSAFAEYGVTSQQIEAKIGHNLASITEAGLARLRKIYTSIKDGVSDASDHFDSNPKPVDESAAPKPNSGTEALTEKVTRKRKEKSEQPPTPPQDPDPVDTRPDQSWDGTPAAPTPKEEPPAAKTMTEKDSFIATVLELLDKDHIAQPFFLNYARQNLGEHHAKKISDISEATLKYVIESWDKVKVLFK